MFGGLVLTMVSAIIGRRGATRAFCSASRAFKRLSALNSERLRVVSYNIHAFRDSDHEDNFDRIVDFLSPLDADVICLQECLNQYAGGPPDYFSTVRRGEGRGVPLHFAGDETYLERLASSLAMPSHNFVQAERDLCYFGSIPFGCALLTRLDVVDWSSTVMKSSEDDSLLGDQERDFAESRAALWATLRFQGSDVVVATTHLDHKAEELRLKQIKSCLEAVSSDAKNEGEDKPLLICGDFNTFQMRDHGEQQWKDILSFYESRGWPSPSETSQVLEYLETQQFHDARHLFDPHSYPDVTCWTHRPLFRIDHCLVSDTFKDKFSVVSFDTPSTSASDHYPIVVDFRLAKT